MFKRPWFLLTIILVTAFIIRASAAVYWDCHYTHGGFVYGDSDGYWTLGQHIAEGQNYEYYGRQIFRMPGYPAFLAMLMSVFGTSMPILYARVAGAVLGTICVWQAWLIGRLLHGERAGLFIALGATFYPEFVLICPMILSETLFCVFLLAQMYFWTRWLLKPSWKDGLLIGLFAGLATLVKPGWILFTPGAIIALGLFRLLRNRRYFLAPWIAILSLFIVLTPWVYRNYRISGQWIFTTLQAGPSIMDGLNPNANGSSNMSFMPAIYERFGAKSNGQVENIEQELAVNNYTRQAAWNWAKAHPTQVLYLSGIKLLRTWTLFPNQTGFSSLPIRLLFGIPYIILWIFVGISLNCSGQKTDFWLLSLLTILYISGIQSLLIGSMRYRLPAMWMLMILGGKCRVLSAKCLGKRILDTKY